jgi:hypothetical protein
MSDTGAIALRFDAWKVPMTTFGEQASAAPHLEDDAGVEERPGYKKRNPSIDSKAEWPEFYREHEADISALWERAVEYMFENEGLADFTPGNEDDEDESED